MQHSARSAVDTQYKRADCLTLFKYYLKYYVNKNEGRDNNIPVIDLLYFLISPSVTLIANVTGHFLESSVG